MMYKDSKPITKKQLLELLEGLDDSQPILFTTEGGEDACTLTLQVSVSDENGIVYLHTDVKYFDD